MRQAHGPVGPPLNTDANTLSEVRQLAFADDDRQLLCKRGAVDHGWSIWPVAADLRAVGDLQADAQLCWRRRRQASACCGMTDAGETQRLRQRDPGPWLAEEPRPVTTAARAISGHPIPVRGAGVSPLLLDLTNHYSMALDGIYNMIETVMPGAGGIPYGTPRLDGVDYDVRGRLELRFGSGGTTGSHEEIHVLPQARGIAVPAVPIAALHVLLFAPRPTPVTEEMTYANVRLHYRDGSQALLPIRTQRDDVPG